MNQPLGLYLHIPFCRTRCRYCDFYRVGENRARMSQFVQALDREIAATEFYGRPVDTVFFGGGTPSLLEPEEMAGILEHLARRFRLDPEAEVSMEANPSDLTPERIRGYRQAGVNRLSLGVQSLSDRELALLGRRHDAARAQSCVGWAREAGFDNLSLDLMLGIPGQTEGSFRRTLNRAVALDPDHLSLYILEIHEGLEMDLLRRRRPRLFPSEEAQGRRYLQAHTVLTGAGLDHYEISNFCRPGRASRHNLKYWRLEPYLGFGPAAHSFVDGRRWRHPPDLWRYLADPLAREELPCNPSEERAFLGLRLREGVELAVLEQASGSSPRELLRLVTDLSPFVVQDGERVRMTPQGFLASTAVVAELLGGYEWNTGKKEGP